jgi:hypothetical protein
MKANTVEWMLPALAALFWFINEVFVRLVDSRTMWTVLVLNATLLFAVGTPLIVRRWPVLPTSLFIVVLWLSGALVEAIRQFTSGGSYMQIVAMIVAFPLTTLSSAVGVLPALILVTALAAFRLLTPVRAIQ